MPSLADVDLTDLVERWLHTKLAAGFSGASAPLDGIAADPNHRITKEPVGDRALPVVKFSYQSDNVIRGVGVGAYYWTRYLYAVRGVTKGSATGTPGQISARIYSSIAETVNDETVTGLVVLASTFFSHFRLEHDEGNERFIELGGIYQLDAQTKE